MKATAPKRLVWGGHSYPPHRFGDSTRGMDSHKYGNVGAMKTTLEIPDLLFRRAKLVAAERGIPSRKPVEMALTEKARPCAGFWVAQRFTAAIKPNFNERFSA